MVKNVFKNTPKCQEDVFIDEQDIDSPTLLISAQFTTNHWLLKNFPRLSVLPLNERIGLKLYFENLYDEEVQNKEDVPFFIVHQEDKQKRFWRINLPHLKKRGDCCQSEIETLFKPEVPGNHRLYIKQVEGFRYADKHGLTNRPYKIGEGDWSASFYVCSNLEFGFYKMAYLALAISVCSLIFSIISLIP